MTKWTVHKKHRTTQKDVEHQDVTDIQKNYFCFLSEFDFSYKISSMISPRKVELPPWYGHRLS